MSRAPIVQNLPEVTNQIRSVVTGKAPHLYVRTSGSSGSAKRVALSGGALRASATATYDRIGGPGQWLLCLPTDHIAGIQVLARSIIADTQPVVMERTGSFEASGFVRATKSLTDLRRYVSLVPTQVVRLLEDKNAVSALRDFSAILLGGAAPSATLMDRIHAAELPVIVTYGMTETAGGCVYDGIPLDAAHIAVAPDGRIFIAGAVLADGYAHESGTVIPLTSAQLPPGSSLLEASPLDAGAWFGTQDRGEIRDGRLVVLGRLDDVIVCGGINISTLAVSDVVNQVVSAQGESRHVFTFGVSDEIWGQQVVIVLDGERDEILSDEFAAQLREQVRRRCGRAATPRAVVQLADFPMLSNGKYDRVMIRSRVEALLGL